MHDPIYKAQAKPYADDLNDLIKADLEKGGPGSGTKGHITQVFRNSLRHHGLVDEVPGKVDNHLHIATGREKSTHVEIMGEEDASKGANKHEPKIHPESASHSDKLGGSLARRHM